MTIFITGSTGVIGSQVVANLADHHFSGRSALHPTPEEFTHCRNRGLAPGAEVIWNGV